MIKLKCGLKIDMLGKNRYKIKGANDLKRDEYQSLFLLYQPMISNEAVMIYCYFLNRIKDEGYIVDILANLNISLDILILGLEKLNEYRLLDTYHNIENDSYLFVLKEPKSTKVFLKDDIFSRILLDTIGSQRYGEIHMALYEAKENMKAYVDETKHLKINTLINWTKEKENDFHKIKNIEVDSLEHKSHFDIDVFVKEASPVLLPFKFRTKEVLETIGRYADVFNISQNQMRVIVGKVVNSDLNEFNYARFKNLCAKVRQNFEKTQSGKYDVSCTLFLMNLQEGREPSPMDMQLISELLDKYHLNAEVINVLIEHSLNVCDNRLIASYVKSLASDLHRNNIYDAVKAKEFLNKNIKVKNAHPKDVLPVYDDSKNRKYDVNDYDILKLIKESNND